MRVGSHVAYSLLPSAAVYYVTRSLLAVGAFLLGSILIDVDHYMEYVSTTGDHNLLKAYRYCVDIDNEFATSLRKEPIFHYFHNIEFFLAVLFLSFVYPLSIWLSLGLVLHYAMDMYHIVKDLHVGVRRYSLIGHLLHRMKGGRKR